MNRFNVFKNDAGFWQWRLVAANGRVVMACANHYNSEDIARRAASRAVAVAVNALTTLDKRKKSTVVS
jgi:uncharacterized protein YegP (UPF0339 family)